MTTNDISFEFVCCGCGKEWDTECGLFCDDCYTDFWKDPQKVLEYFHFCGIPATLEQIEKMLGVPK